MQEQPVTGGIIAAASKRDAYPLLKLGSITAVRRVVLTFQQAGVFPVVIITGYAAEEIERQLADAGVIFLRNENYEKPQLFDSVKIGLSYLLPKCDRVVVTPVNVPMFSPDTLKKLMEMEGGIVTPSYLGKAGHPVVLHKEVIPDVLAYNGPAGLRGALAALESRRRWVNVEDEGILHNVYDLDRLNEHLDEHNRAILHPLVRLSIERETLFFNARTKLLLILIEDTQSVRSACDHMALSYGKAWEMLNALEQELGYPVVHRRHGGSRGGRTQLTEQGKAFLTAYGQFEQNVRAYAQQEFDSLFRETKLL
ncbi:MAG TPA: NTP transferase domain-containing protein [Feifaniaceae bacterium]|nr:NTP transferase domain-containing protein [Feifaniaceae bacterium]